MLFQKKIWEIGDPVTKDELNRIESGIYEALLILANSNQNLSIQAGRVSVTESDLKSSTDGIYTYEKVIAFDNQFKTKPFGIVCAETGKPLSVSASIKSSSYITKGQMTIVLQRKTASTSTSVSWIAVAPTEV